MTSPWIRHQAPLAPTTSLTTPGPSLASTSASPEDSGSFDTMKASASPADPLAASIAELGARVSTSARALGLDDIAARVDADLTRRMGDGRLRVAIIGEIKHGKSSLINALAGAEVLPTGVTPTTGALVSVRAGDQDVRRLAHHDGSSSALSHDRFASLARGTRDDEEANPGMLIAELHAPRIPAEIELVDTPGLNDMHRLRALVSEGESPRADVLVLVLDATQARLDRSSS